MRSVVDRHRVREPRHKDEADAQYARECSGYSRICA